MKIRAAVNTLLSLYGNKPLKAELAVVLYGIDLPIRKISHIAALSNGKVYDAISDYKANPFPFKLWFDSSTLIEIEKFIQAFDKFAGYNNIIKR